MKSASRAADSATNLREAADFETPDPAVMPADRIAARLGGFRVKKIRGIDAREWDTTEASASPALRPPLPPSVAAAITTVLLYLSRRTEMPPFQQSKAGGEADAVTSAPFQI